MSQFYTGSAVTQTVLDGLLIHPLVANFWSLCWPKSFENWLTEPIVEAIIKGAIL